jgi:serine/threonine-protein kinase
MALTPGTRLGVYEILSLIGSGGMGEVYGARDTRLGRDVAIKVLPSEVAADPDRLARFEREAQVLASLNHPNIAHIHGIDDSSGAPALVMELVEGPTLADRIAKGPIPLDEALPIAKQIAEGLEGAHEQGIIHRDLKPANIKVRPDGTVKILDFGLAKAFDPVASTVGNATMSPTLSMHATQAGLILGSAAYMAPEQVRGAVVDRRADIWAFGVVLTEMLVGGRLFSGDTISDTLAGVLREPIDLDRLPDRTPQPVRDLLRRCLERDPKRRLRDIGEARITLEDYLANPHLDAATPRASHSRYRRWPAAVVGVIAVVVFASAIAATFRLRQPDVAAPDHVTMFELELGGLALRRNTPVGQYLAISRDGRRLVLAAGNPNATGSPDQRLFLHQIDRVGFDPIPGTENSGIPFISPNGEWVAFQSGGELKKVSFAGGVAVRICDVTGLAQGATWMDDDTIVFALNGQLFRVAAGGGVPQPVTPKRSNALYEWPSAVPGRRAILYTLRTDMNDGVRRFAVGALDLDANLEHSLIESGTYPKLVQSFLLYGQQATGEAISPFSGGILAVPFDARRLALTGHPTPVLDRVIVHAGGAANYDVTSNGTIVFVAGTMESVVRSLAWMSPAPNGPPVIEPLAGSGGNTLLEVHLTSDDRNALVQMTRAGIGDYLVYVYNMARGSLTRVPFDGPASRPVLGPGDGFVTFWSANGLWMEPIDGSKPAERLTTSTRLQFPGSWTRDGTRLVFTQSNNGPGDILVLNRSDHAALPLIESKYDERDPVLSPDDRWLAYSSNESGRSEIYVRPFQGSGGRYPVSTGGGQLPVWSKDGRRLFYVQAETSLMAVDVMAAASFDAGKPTLVMNSQFLGRRSLTGGPLLRSYDVARDGRILSINSSELDSRADRLRVMLNFDSEIRRRVGAPNH